MARRKRKGSKGGTGFGTGRRGRPGRLSRLTIQQLQAELDRRRSAVPVLQRRRDELLQLLSGIESELSGLGEMVMGAGASVVKRVRTLGRRRGPGRPPGPARRGRRAATGTGRTRASNSMNLVDALHQVLRGTTMSVTEVAGAVQKAGYKTSSPNFRTIVNAALLSNKGRFQKVARGQYTAKS